MVSSQLHYTKVNRFMPFLLAEILNFQGSTHRIGVGSFSYIIHSKYIYQEGYHGKILIYRVQFTLFTCNRIIIKTSKYFYISHFCKSNTTIIQYYRNC